MKPKLLIVIAAVLLAAVFFLAREATAATTPAKTAAVTYPYGKTCVVSMDHKWSADAAALDPGKDSGFETDWTIRGTLTYLSDEWLVLSSGTYEHWLPRDKIMLIRVWK
jgi:hypothetical protein